MGFDTHQKCLQYFEIGPEFCKTHIIRGTILYPCKSSICAFASSYSCITYSVFSDKVIEIIEIADYGPAHSPTRACWITFRGLFNSCQVPENISVNA